MTMTTTQRIAALLAGGVAIALIAIRMQRLNRRVHPFRLNDEAWMHDALRQHDERFHPHLAGKRPTLHMSDLPSPTALFSEPDRSLQESEDYRRMARRLFDRPTDEVDKRISEILESIDRPPLLPKPRSWPGIPPVLNSEAGLSLPDQTFSGRMGLSPETRADNPCSQFWGPRLSSWNAPKNDDPLVYHFTRTCPTSPGSMTLDPMRLDTLYGITPERSQDGE